MSVSLVITGRPADLLDLEAALRGDPGVKGAVLDRVVRDPEAGEMGPVVEALSWITEHKELLTAVAGAITAWIESRRTTIRVRTGDQEIEITSSAAPDARELAEILRRAGEGPEADPEPSHDV